MSYEYSSHKIGQISENDSLIFTYSLAIALHYNHKLIMTALLKYQIMLTAYLLHIYIVVMTAVHIYTRSYGNSLMHLCLLKLIYMSDYDLRVCCLVGNTLD